MWKMEVQVQQRLSKFDKAYLGEKKAIIRRFAIGYTLRDAYAVFLKSSYVLIDFHTKSSGKFYITLQKSLSSYMSVIQYQPSTHLYHASFIYLVHIIAPLPCSYHSFRSIADNLGLWTWYHFSLATLFRKLLLSFHFKESLF